ncbi:PspC domain-containing protein [Solirubrobacter phytolaccae]|uniref:PspC domain-containing protein n=1 Tax=Solirubrobacter phytolaccae TaxID=1404360 RepID=A0A9X3S9S4_9ACTN|nr:PspC domain-containing protein [Solirubrobacter phytolaccae]MDA0179555.1 PspC domain-containing protein [Solirubrobacter phytolaccae]
MDLKNKPLTRSSTDKKVGGVCAGLADYFGVDTTVTRVGFILTTLFTGGAAALAYVAMMVVMPTDTKVMGHDPLATL